MKGFTLIEIAVISGIIILLTAISFRFTVFDRRVIYIKDFIYNLGTNIQLLREFSLGRRIISNQKVCGYGLFFNKNDFSYTGYAFLADGLAECDKLANEKPSIYATDTPVYFLHSNGEIRQTPIQVLQIKDIFQKRQGTSDDLKISLDQNCSLNFFNSYSKINLVYYNPYGDILLLGKNSGSWQNLLPSNWQNIYFCLQYKNDIIKFRINRAGQLVF